MLSVMASLNFLMYFLWALVPSLVDTELISCKLSLADLQGPKMHEINDAFVHWEFVCYSTIRLSDCDNSSQHTTSANV